MGRYNTGDCNFVLGQAREQFEQIKSSWLEVGRWAAPDRTRWLDGQGNAHRRNQHIFDPTHLLALRSYVAGFLEGNTSASRPWFRHGHKDKEVNRHPTNREFFDKLTRRCFETLGSSSNFYNAAAFFYRDYGVFNTGAHFIEELPNRRLHFHTLTPGSYYILNNSLGEADVLVREFTLSVKALVDKYGLKNETGKVRWDNFSKTVKDLYDNNRLTHKINVVNIVKKNPYFNPAEAIGGENRQWVSVHYEAGSGSGTTYAESMDYIIGGQPSGEDKFLRIAYSKRKPFIVGKSQSSDNYEYGETGPTVDALGIVRSLSKKAIHKDIALEQMVSPTVQGPASLKKTYRTNQPNRYLPIDPTALRDGGVKRVFEIVDKIYYADFLLFLSKNPKTRTATEAAAIVNEQQLVIGPNLQSLNSTYNVPLVDYITDYVLDTDPTLGEVPDGLKGQLINTDFISVFAQAQKAADLPQIERYMAMITQVGQVNPTIWQKANVDELADIYADRLYLPAGLNRDQATVDADREKAQAMAQRQQKIEELTQMAGAQKDLSAAKQQK
jgi:hypothetical protein